ncbi:hypothetical protein J6590_037788 [Homalodisca vitripennis]|nr:hypothetical protein J6590_037788 [Homalodisca vitripennis]
MKLAIAEDEEEKRNIERMKEIHLRKADLAREKLDAAKEESKNNSNVYSFTFDLQKADQPFKIFYKETLNDDIPFDCLDITPAKKGRRMVSLASITTEALYSSPRPVTAAKKKDMMDLLAFIPPIHHSFYTDLTVGNQPEGIDDTPIIDRCSESESDDEKD